MPNSSIFHLVGLMSGTSCDGLDMAFCRFEYNGQWKSEIIRAETEPFSKDLTTKLRNAPDLPGLQLSLLDREFGYWMGKAKILSEIPIKSRCCCFPRAYGISPTSKKIHFTNWQWVGFVSGLWFAGNL